MRWQRRFSWRAGPRQAHGILTQTAVEKLIYASRSRRFCSSFWNIWTLFPPKSGLIFSLLGRKERIIVCARALRESLFLLIKKKLILLRNYYKILKPFDQLNNEPPNRFCYVVPRTNSKMPRGRICKKDGESNGGKRRTAPCFLASVKPAFTCGESCLVNFYKNGKIIKKCILRIFFLIFTN